MNTIVSWLNTNQGFVMSILTFVYVVSTIIIVVYNRKSINEMKEARIEDSRPYIFAHMYRDARDNFFSLQIKNYGKTAGKINSLNILPKLNFVKWKNVEPSLKEIVLAPNQTIYISLGEIANETLNQTEYDVEINYTWIGRDIVYKEEYKLFIDYTKHVGYADKSKSQFTNSENMLYNIAPCVRIVVV